MKIVRSRSPGGPPVPLVFALVTALLVVLMFMEVCGALYSYALLSRSADGPVRCPVLTACDPAALGRHRVITPG